MRSGRHLVIAVFAIGLAVAGCDAESTGVSPSSSPATSSAASPLMGGQFRLTQSEGTLTVLLPSSSDRTVQAVNAYASKVGAEGGQTFALLQARNDGSDTIYVCGMRIVDSTGKTVTFQWARDYVGGLYEGSDGDLYNEGVALYNTLLDPDQVPPGETVNSVMVATQPVDGVATVFSGLLPLDEVLLSPCDSVLEPVGTGGSTS